MADFFGGHACTPNYVQNFDVFCPYLCSHATYQNAAWYEDSRGQYLSFIDKTADQIGPVTVEKGLKVLLAYCSKWRNHDTSYVHKIL